MRKGDVISEVSYVKDGESIFHGYRDLEILSVRGLLSLLGVAKNHLPVNMTVWRCLDEPFYLGQYKISPGTEIEIYQPTWDPNVWIKGRYDRDELKLNEGVVHRFIKPAQDDYFVSSDGRKCPEISTELSTKYCRNRKMHYLPPWQREDWGEDLMPSSHRELIRRRYATTAPPRPPSCPPPAIESDSQTWSCVKCTYANHNGTECEMCGTIKPIQ